MNELHTILLIDDEPDSVRYLFDGWSTPLRVIEARHGTSAVEQIQSIRNGASCSLIILDVMVPVIDPAGDEMPPPETFVQSSRRWGVKLLHQLRDDPELKILPTIPIVVHTVLKGKDVQDACRQYNAFFCPKDRDQEMRAHVARALGLGLGYTPPP